MNSGVVNYVEPFAGSAAMLLGCPGWGDPMTAPFPYFGGKSRAVKLVWERFGPALPRVFTINDENAFVANFWRATAFDPEAVARWADWPVNETDLHSRHRWLLKMVSLLRARLDADPMAYDAKIAGWWVWGASAWIGSGWCEEGRARPSEQLPALTGVAPDRRCIGSGVHSGAMRATGKRLPDLSGGTQWGTDEPNTRAGKGTHSAAVRTRLYDLFAALSERLRYVRVACGDFERILTDAVTHRHGLTAVFLDPEYLGFSYVYGQKLSRAQEEHCSIRAHRWAQEAGKRPDMRIALCGYEGEHDLPGWECVPWKAKGGYANAGDGSNKNARRERIWFSPACLKPGRDVGQFVFPGVL